MKQYLTLFISVFSLAVNGQVARIKAVENGLLPQVQIEGKPFIHYSIAERLKFYHISSVSIAVINHGRLAWAKAYGYADMATHQPATANTLYQAASLSKTVNAMLIMKLVQQRRLSLDTDVRRYLKTWRFPDNDSSRARAITLRSLLSHTAGINVQGFAGYDRNSSLPSLDNILNGSAPANNGLIKPVMLPGTAVMYSGGGIMITQKIIEDQTGADYARLITDQVLNPLRMKHSVYAMPLPQSMEKTIATGYDEQLKPLPGRYKVYPELAPAGLWTTPADMAKLVIAMQRDYRDGKTTMLTPVLDNNALGTFIYRIGGDTYFTHLGHNAGYMAAYYGNMAEGDGIVIMVNSDNNQIMPEIVKSVAAAYHWKGFYQPQFKTAVLLPDSMTDHYTGSYYCTKLKRTIQLKKRAGHLEMHQELEFPMGRGCFEQVWFSDERSFFILASGLAWNFENDGQTLIIKDGDDRYEAVKVMTPIKNEI